jgi:hypothetical protein
MATGKTKGAPPLAPRTAKRPTRSSTGYPKGAKQFGGPRVKAPSFDMPSRASEVAFQNTPKRATAGMMGMAPPGKPRSTKKKSQFKPKAGRKVF